MNVIDWCGLVLASIDQKFWAHSEEALHSRLMYLGGIRNGMSIDVSGIPYFNELESRIMSMLLGVRALFREEIHETIPILYPFIYRSEIPPKDSIKDICREELDFDYMDPSPVQRMLLAIAYKLNSQLWKVEPIDDI